MPHSNTYLVTLISMTFDGIVCSDINGILVQALSAVFLAEVGFPLLLNLACTAGEAVVPQSHFFSPGSRSVGLSYNQIHRI